MPSFEAAGFFDVYVSPGNTFSGVTIKFCSGSAADHVLWFNGTAWAAVSNAVFDAGSQCWVTTVDATTSPTLAQLAGTAFTIAQVVTLHLDDSTGAGLPGGTATAYYSGSWHNVSGTTDATGALIATGVPKVGSLVVRMQFNGTQTQQTLAQLTASGFTFQTVSTSVTLKDHKGDPLDVGTASYYAGGWHSIGTTSGGIVSAEMLPGTYSFAMGYQGSRQQLDGQVISTPNASVTFRTKLVTLKLVSHSGAALDTGTAAYYAGNWRTIGATSGGQVTLELFQGSYSFAMVYDGTRQQLDGQNVGTNPTVTFTTGQVHSASGAATQYYAGSWLNFTQDMELLQGTYTFSFNGHANVSETLAGGVVNSIY